MQAAATPRLSLREGRAIWLAMRRDVEIACLLAASPVRTALKAGVLFVLLAGALALAWSSASLWLSAAAWIALALLLAQFAFIGHDAGHLSAARSAGGNRAFGQLCMTLVTGLAFDEWIARHRAHHRHCQVEAHDPDMAVDAVVSLTEGSRHAKGPFGRFMTRYQGATIWVLSLLFGHSQRHLSQWVVLRAPQRHPLDALVLGLHFGLWFALPCLVLGVPVGAALLAYLVPLTLLGPYLAAIFWVNHIGMPLVEAPERFSFLEHQAVTSRTVLCAPAWHWVFGGLNFQVEHHLFPKVPSGRLAQVQAIVRRHFDSHCVDYHAVPWPAACAAVAAHLRAVARAA
ncbi:MAG: acyl-CoA desaturase [Pseudomonadota bacterium]